MPLLDCKGERESMNELNLIIYIVSMLIVGGISMLIGYGIGYASRTKDEIELREHRIKGLRIELDQSIEEHKEREMEQTKKETPVIKKQAVKKTAVVKKNQVKK